MLFNATRLVAPIFVGLTLGSTMAPSVSQDVAPDRPTVNIRLGHSFEVGSVVVSPDGKLIASHANRTIIIWRASNGALLQTLPGKNAAPGLGHRGLISSAFAPDSQTIATLDDTGALCFWNARTGEQTQTFSVYPERKAADQQRRASTLTWSADGKLMVIAGTNFPVEVWDVAAGKQVYALPPATVSMDVTLVAGGQIIETKSNSERRRPIKRDANGKPLPPPAPEYWDATTGAPAPAPAAGAALPPDLANLQRMASGPGGRAMLAAGTGNADEAEGGGGRPSGPGRMQTIAPVFWTPGKEPARGERVNGAPQHIRYSADGSRVVFSSLGTVRMWDTSTAAVMATIPLPRSITALDLSPDGNAIAVGQADGSVCVVTGVPAGGQPITTTLSTGLVLGHGGAFRWWVPGRVERRVVKLAMAPSGIAAAVAYADGKLALWDLRTASVLKAWDLPEYELAALAWSPDGRTLATATVRKNRGQNSQRLSPSDILLWDTTTFAIRKVIPSIDMESIWEELAFSPDSQLLAALNSGRNASRDEKDTTNSPGIVFNAQTGERVAGLRAGTVGPDSVTFAASGRILALSDGNGLMIYDLPNYTRRGPAYRYSNGADGNILFSTDGSTLITGTKSGTIVFTPIPAVAPTDKEAEKAGYIRGRSAQSRHRDRVTVLANSPDGQHVASGSFDGLVKVWNITTGNEVRQFEDTGGMITGLGYGSQGKTIVAGGTDGTVKVWDSATGALRVTLEMLPPLGLPVRALPTQPNRPNTNPDGTTPPAPVPVELSWLAYTPDGFYQAANEDAITAVATWTVNGQLVAPAARATRFKNAEAVRSSAASKP